MRINPIRSVTYTSKKTLKRANDPDFQKNVLKREFVKGKMPSVIHGIYGGILTPKNATLEHILPKSKGGKTVLSNLALAVDVNNWKRADKPLIEFFDKEAFDQYCEEMKQVNLPGLKGSLYVENLIKTVNEVLKEGK